MLGSTPEAPRAAAPEPPRAPEPAPPPRAPEPSSPELAVERAEHRVGKLTLAHYAALTVEMGRNPPDPSSVLRRYGLAGTDELQYVKAAFQAQMQVDPALRAQFDSMVARMLSMAPRQG
jgi:hypothetical protein